VKMFGFILLYQKNPIPEQPFDTLTETHSDVLTHSRSSST
jgi:hypothetical protein